MHDTVIVAATVTVLLTTAVPAADSPQFGGPNRDGVFPESGLLKQWPEGGPPKLWTAEADLGGGFSSVSVVGDAIYTTGIVDRQDTLFALDLEGKLRWKVAVGPGWTRSHGGSRCTPTIHDGRAYVMTGKGVAACYDTNGKELWKVDTFERFGGRAPSWGIAESPLIVDDKVICTPGGRDASIVAFDRKTGKEIWRTRALSDKSAYCSPRLIRDGKRDLIVTVTENGLVGVSPGDGAVYWKRKYRGSCAAHPNTPLYHDGRVYFTSGYDAGGVMVALSEDGRRFRPVWTDKTLDTHHGGVVLIDGHIYGASWRGNGNGNWVCLSWNTGKPAYESHWHNKGSTVAADGMLYCYEERRGNLALVEPTPREFRIVSSFQITEGRGPHWAHPVIANGRLYVRHGNKLMCYDVKAK